MELVEKELTKGEALILGIEQVRTGLDMIGAAGSKEDLVRVLVGSKTAATNLKALLRQDLFRPMVIAMVSARNARLAEDTVERVIDDFLAVIQDLAQPYKPPKAIAPSATGS